MAVGINSIVVVIIVVCAIFTECEINITIRTNNTIAKSSL